MSFPGYSVTLFDPRPEPVRYDDLPDFFTGDYFTEHLLEKWPESSIRYSDDGRSLTWWIPTLDSGDPRNEFAGLLSLVDKGIAFGSGSTPYETIAEFLLWMRSIVPFEFPVYFLEISEFAVLELRSDTSAEDIYEFFAQVYKKI